MKLAVFISWTSSCTISQAMAFGLKELLTDVLQAADPWLAEDDIQPGERWRVRIEERATDAVMAILCLTPRGRLAEWIHFEAGAISKVSGATVVPLMCGMTAADLPSTLAPFQAIGALDFRAMFGLVRALAGRLPSADRPLDSTLEKALKVHFLDFKAAVEAAVQAEQAARPATPDPMTDRLIRLEQHLMQVLEEQRSLATRLDNAAAASMRKPSTAEALPVEED